MLTAKPALPIARHVVLLAVFVHLPTRALMTFRSTFVVFSSLAAVSLAALAQSPVRPTPAGAGEEMYVSYCAACHGMDGRGTGPVVPALRTPAPDLTILTKRNHREFPNEHVRATIRGDLLVVAHGSKDMPIWGPLLRYVGGGTKGEVEVRIDNLIRYIQSLQEPTRE
jgi:mono/diheme cytochrome c family protein